MKLNVTLRALLDALRATGQAKSIDLSTTVIPVVDVRSMLEDETGATLGSAEVAVVNDVTLAAAAGAPGFVKGVMATPAAGLTPGFQLWNPAASGRTLQLDAFHYFSNSSSVVDVRRHNVALGGFLGVGRSRSLSGADSPLTELRNGNDTAGNWSLYGTPLFALAALAAYDGKTYEPPRTSGPILIPPGWGLTVIHLNTPATQGGVSFEWREV